MIEYAEYDWTYWHIPEKKKNKKKTVLNMPEL